MKKIAAYAQLWAFFGAVVGSVALSMPMPATSSMLWHIAYFPASIIFHVLMFPAQNPDVAFAILPISIFLQWLLLGFCYGMGRGLYLHCRGRLSDESQNRIIQFLQPKAAYLLFILIFGLAVFVLFF